MKRDFICGPLYEIKMRDTPAATFARINTWSKKQGEDQLIKIPGIFVAY